jgi:hypothetical protein
MAFETKFISITQVTDTPSSATCKVEILFELNGPHSNIDLVQVYAIPAGQTISNGLGNVVDSVDVSIPENQYASVPELPAGSSFTIALCPRSKTGSTLDDQIDGQYWETFCVFQPFTTTLTLGIGSPQVSVSSIKPATLNQPNQVAIAYSGNDYTDGQVLWGPVNNPRQTEVSFQPAEPGNEPVYNGTYTANIPPALQGQILSFTVQVKNSYTDDSLWYPTTIGVLSARNYRSVSQFLQASNVQLPTGIKYLLKGGHSVRALLQI